MIKRGDGTVDPAKLRALVQRVLDQKEEVAGINKDLSDDVKVAAVEMKLHKAAFNQAVALMKMGQVKRLAHLEALDNYRHILGLDDAPQAELEDAIRAVKATGAQISVVRS